jgi:hypothetical protein
MRDEALKLALEALEKHGVAPKDWACKECVPFSDILKDGFQCKYHEAITACQQALTAQPAPVHPVAWLIPGSITTDPELAKANGDKAVALGKISTQQWNPEDHYKDGWRDALESVKRATPPAAPVLEGRDWSLLEATQESLREHMAEIKRLKAAQPAVPLTPEQIIDIRRKTTAKTHGEWADTKTFARAIEAAHGITEKGQP